MCVLNPRCSVPAVQERLEKQLCHHLGLPRVASFRAIFGHVDMEVCWLTDKCVFVNDYSACEPREKILGMDLHAKIRSCFPDLVQVPLPFTGHSQRESTKYDPVIEAQQTLYNAVNYVQSVVTPHAVYVPAFGHLMDKLAVSKVRAAVKSSGVHREVIPVVVGQLAHFGGSLHCATTQLRGKPAFDFLQRFVCACVHVYVCVCVCVLFVS